MRQAIEEGFILDVLTNYTTYKAYWRLLKKIEDDPRYDKKKAEYLLKSFVELHPHAIDEKVRIMRRPLRRPGAERDRRPGQSDDRHPLAPACGALQAAFDRYLEGARLSVQGAGRFSGTVQDGGAVLHRSGNERLLREARQPRAFERPEYRFLIVANKFQTGFDQPLLHTMYVDKKLGGVNAVQTLSRLNRTHPRRSGTMVLDFANEADEIRAAFEPYYETTLLSEATDPNLLYEIQRRLLDFPVYTEADVESFARVYFDPKATQDQLYAALAPMVERFQALPEEQHDFRGQLTDYVRLYAFLAQVLTFADADLEKLYVFARHLRRLLPADRDAASARSSAATSIWSPTGFSRPAAGKIALERKAGMLEPMADEGSLRGEAREELETLSQIIAELNERFGMNLGPEHRVTLDQMMEKLDTDRGARCGARGSTRAKTCA